MDDHCDSKRAALRTVLQERGIGAGVLDAVTAVDRCSHTGDFDLLGHRRRPRLDPERTPQEWLTYLYAPDAAVQLVLPGQPSACLAVPPPAVLATMLDLADIHPGHTVLELGTGSGYTTALACHLAGHGRVHSLDPHPGWHQYATRALARRARTGCTRDLTLTDYDRPRADRILAWREPDHLPRGWLDHLAPGGRIVTVYGGVITTLIPAPGGDFTAEFGQGTEVTALHANPAVRPRTVWDDLANLPTPVRPDAPGLRLMLRWLMPGLRWTHSLYPRQRIDLHDAATGSHAEVSCADPDTQHTQTGPVPLWDRMRQITALWHRLGNPDPTEFTATLDPARDTPVLQRHGRPVTLPAPGSDRTRCP